MAAGLPVVASDVPACRETLGDGRWGELVPASDPAALARAVIRRLGNSTSDDTPERRGYLHGFSPGALMSSYLKL
jgi:glycosyltransferase involved in cell wall biosynthesis